MGQAHQRDIDLVPLGGVQKLWGAMFDNVKVNLWIASAILHDQERER